MFITFLHLPELLCIIAIFPMISSGGGALAKGKGNVQNHSRA